MIVKYNIYIGYVLDAQTVCWIYPTELRITYKHENIDWRNTNSITLKQALISLKQAELEDKYDKVMAEMKRINGLYRAAQGEEKANCLKKIQL